MVQGSGASVTPPVAQGTADRQRDSSTSSCRLGSGGLLGDCASFHADEIRAESVNLTPDVRMLVWASTLNSRRLGSKSRSKLGHETVPAPTFSMRGHPLKGERTRPVSPFSAPEGEVSIIKE